MLRQKVLKDILVALFTGNPPGQLIIQINDYCNATCTQCEMNRNNPFKRNKLSVSKVRELIDSSVRNGVMAISFTGGEPFLWQDELFGMIKHATSSGIKFTRTGTNGFMFANSDSNDFEKKIHIFAKKIKESGLYTFWISLDSWDIDKHEKNRGFYGSVKGIEKSLRIFEQYSLYPSVNLGLNRLIEVCAPSYEENDRFIPEACYTNYRLGLSRFFQFSIELGFTIANLCYPMSCDSVVYKATSTNKIVKYTSEEKKALFKAVFDTIPKYRDKIRIFTPLSSILTIIRQYKGEDVSRFGCLGGSRYFFVDSCGDIFPCGFMPGRKFESYNDAFGQKISEKCLQCDWECFRDPSVLFSPIIGFRKNFFSQLTDIFGDKTFYREWINDIRYYKKCNFFNMHTSS
jgi:MoaA/NifB/PqqE/SkfB family radical SAM enzyme